MVSSKKVEENEKKKFNFTYWEVFISSDGLAIVQN